jgi:hypothetical protein
MMLSDTINTEGYGVVSIVTNSSFGDKDQVTCAGYLEVSLDKLFISPDGYREN